MGRVESVTDEVSGEKEEKERKWKKDAEKKAKEKKGYSGTQFCTGYSIIITFFGTKINRAKNEFKITHVKHEQKAKMGCLSRAKKKSPVCISQTKP